jgi:ATP-binding cassette subfamily C protein LapB
MNPDQPPASDTAAGARAVQARLAEALEGATAAGRADAPLHDPLAAALSVAARIVGISLPAETLGSGLPLVAGRLAPDQLGEAAARAGLLLSPLPANLRRMDGASLPVLALRADGTAVVIERLLRSPKGRVEGVVLAGSEEALPLKALARPKLLAAWSVRPASRVDDPVPGLPPPVRRHWLAEAMWPNRGIYAQVLVVTAVLNLLALAIPLYTMNVYDRVVPNQAVETLWALTLGVLLATAFEFALRMLRASLLDGAGRRADVVLANRLHARMLGARLSAGAGAVGTRAQTLREFEALRDFFTSATLAAFGDLPFLFLFVFVTFIVAGPLALVPLIAIPVVLGLVLALHGPMKRQADRSLREAGLRNAVLVETIAGAETIKALGAESWAARRFEQATADGIRVAVASRLLQALAGNLVASAQTLVTVATVVLGCFLVFNGSITAGALMAAMMLSGRALAPLGQIALVLARVHQAGMARKALDAVMAAPQERDAQAGYIQRQALHGRVTLSGVSFAFAEDRPPALHEVHLAVEPGERVGLIGGIGSGKSTLLKLIARLHEPSAGRLLLDGLNASQIDPAWLRRRIGYAAQDSTIFRGTLRENLALHAPDASEAMLLAAAETAGALDWIATLPRGLDTAVGEGGQGLSAGQRRTLALARALVLAPPLLLLDEPSAELDGRAEQLLVKRLKAALPGRTLLLVTHRPALLELVDRLIVLENGRITADGPKAQVLAELRRRAEAPAGTVAA